MSATSTRTSKGGIWRLVLRPDSSTLPPYTGALALEAARLAEFISPALAAYLLQPAAARYGRRLIAADPARQSRLANHDARLRLMHWAEVISSAGIDAVFLNEFANAHVLYPDFDLRPMGNLDAVVAEHSVRPLIRLLGGHGFRAADGADKDVVSLTANDASTTIDVRLGLFAGTSGASHSGEAVVAASRMIEIDGTNFRVPCLEHTLLLAVATAAKARFGRLCVREVLDAAMLLRPSAKLDWPAIREVAAASRLGKPLRTLLALLVELGLGAGGLPSDLIRAPRWPARKGFRRVVGGYRELFQIASASSRP